MILKQDNTINLVILNYIYIASVLPVNSLKALIKHLLTQGYPEFTELK